MRDVIRCVVLAVLLLGPATVSGADVNKGLAAYDVGDYETAFAECLPLAQEGNATAQFCIGRMYANGFGVMMDDAEALKWYGMAAASGHAEAQYNLGVMHANGWGVPMNDEEAAKLYRQSAEQGFVQAMSALAYVSYRGIGVDEDVAAGYMWYHVAAELGDFSAIANRDALAEKLSQEDMLTAKANAAKWLEKFSG